MIWKIYMIWKKYFHRKAKELERRDREGHRDDQWEGETSICYIQRAADKGSWCPGIPWLGLKGVGVGSGAPPPSPTTPPPPTATGGVPSPHIYVRKMKSKRRPWFYYMTWPQRPTSGGGCSELRRWRIYVVQQCMHTGQAQPQVSDGWGVTGSSAWRGRGLSWTGVGNCQHVREVLSMTAYWRGGGMACVWGGWQGSPKPDQIIQGERNLTLSHRLPATSCVVPSFIIPPTPPISSFVPFPNPHLKEKWPICCLWLQLHLISHFVWISRYLDVTVFPPLIMLNINPACFNLNT